MQYEQAQRAGVVVSVHHYEYSVLCHLEGLPPVCFLRGMDDEQVPYSRGVQLGEELARRDHPHEFHSYEGLSHYATDADNVTTQQMWQDSLDCLRRRLESKS